MLGAPGFSQQSPVEFVIEGVLLRVPSRHPLLEFLNSKSPHYQPYREAGLRKIAQAMAALGRSGTALDIGANIGDSCAVLHRHGGLKIIAVEPSDFFFAYLKENIARHFGQRAEARQAFVVAKTGEKTQALFHWGGTARPVTQASNEKFEAVAIADLLRGIPDLALFKVDIDGLDMALVTAAVEEKIQCPIYFELEFSWSDLAQIRNGAGDALALFGKALGAGYGEAFLWDDKGRFFGALALSDRAALTNAINYMAQVKDRPVWGFDICLAHDSDAAFKQQLRSLLSADAALPI